MSAGAVLGLLGNVAGIAGQVQGLIPGREEDELRRMTKGRGQGALQARQSAADAQRRAMAVASSARRGGRGFALQQGLRAGTEALTRGNEAAARVASQERASALQMLMQRRNERIQRGIQLGASLAGSLGAAGGFLETQAPAGQPAGSMSPSKYGNPAGLEAPKGHVQASQQAQRVPVTVDKLTGAGPREQVPGVGMVQQQTAPLSTKVQSGRTEIPQDEAIVGSFLGSGGSFQGSNEPGVDAAEQARRKQSMYERLQSDPEYLQSMLQYLIERGVDVSGFGVHGG